jgi:hypothetical protein
MDRSDVGFAASVVGAALLVAGVLDVTPAWVFLVGGAALALAGLGTLRLRGSLLLLLCGGWTLAAPFVPGAAAQWNLMVVGLLGVALGFTAGVSGAAEASR